MIIIEATENAGGVTLYGDYLDLTHLRNTVSNLVEGSSSNSEIKETVLAFNYELRKAYSGLREEKEFVRDTKYFGTKFTFPEILFYLSMLRNFASMQPTTKDNQSMLYNLEGAIESELLGINPSIAKECMELLSMGIRIDENFHSSYLTKKIKEYVLGPVEKARIKKLPKILYSLDFMSEEYRDFSKEISELAENEGCLPSDLWDYSDFPEIQW